MVEPHGTFYLMILSFISKRVCYFGFSILLFTLRFYLEENLPLNILVYRFFFITSTSNFLNWVFARKYEIYGFCTLGWVVAWYMVNFQKYSMIPFLNVHFLLKFSLLCLLALLIYEKSVNFFYQTWFIIYQFLLSFLLVFALYLLKLHF